MEGGRCRQQRVPVMNTIFERIRGVCKLEVVMWDTRSIGLGDVVECRTRFPQNYPQNVLRQGSTCGETITSGRERARVIWFHVAWIVNLLCDGMLDLLWVLIRRSCKSK